MPFAVYLDDEIPTGYALDEKRFKRMQYNEAKKSVITNTIYQSLLYDPSSMIRRLLEVVGWADDEWDDFKREMEYDEVYRLWYRMVYFRRMYFNPVRRDDMLKRCLVKIRRSERIRMREDGRTYERPIDVDSA